jgi:hypothetical protein
MRRATPLLLLFLSLLLALPQRSAAAEAGWRSIGLRGGVNATGIGTVHQDEIFASYELPWQVGSGRAWTLRTKANGALGWLHGGGNDGCIISVGPGLGVEWDHFPVELDGGVSAAFLTEDTFGPRDLNGDVQFISHIGVNFRLLDSLGVGYNFQHMSNASMNGNKNPGINMHMFSLIWYFRR